MKKELQYICGFAARKSPIMVRNAVRITRTFCYASDGTQSMKIGIDGPDLDVCVEASVLHDILAGLPDDQAIKIEPGQGFVTIKGGKRKLKIRTIPVAGMDEIAVEGDFRELDPAVVSQGLKFAMPAAAARDVARPYFNNTIIDFTKKGTFVVGCDGFRGHVFQIDEQVAEVPITCAIPAPLAKRLASLCEVGGSFHINRYRAIYRKGDGEFISVLGDSHYAPWQNIVPTPAKYQCTIQAGRDPMRAIVDSASRLGAKRLSLVAGNGVAFEADLNGDEFEDFLEADVNGGESIVMNPRLLSDALDVLGDGVITTHIPSLSARSTPVLLTNGTPNICFVMGLKA